MILNKKIIHQIRDRVKNQYAFFKWKIILFFFVTPDPFAANLINYKTAMEVYYQQLYVVQSYA